jgi:hypothetical protein
MYVTYIASALIVLWLLLWSVRAAMARKRIQTVQGVWDCGYAKPAVSMQYTPSSYSNPLTELFLPLLRTQKKGSPVAGYFPKTASFSTEVKDWAKEGLFTPLFSVVAKCLLPFRALQHGRVHIYVIYVALTLVGLLIWTSGK